MCLGIAGRVVALPEDDPEIANVDVAGLVRPIHVGLLVGERLRPGDWILIHAGFAMEKIDEETARRQTAALRDYVGEPEEEDGGAGEWPDKEGET